MPANLTKYLFLLSFLCCMMSCRPARFVPEGQYLLDKSPSLEGLDQLGEEDFYGVVKSKANRRVWALLGTKTYLGLYNWGRLLASDTLKEIDTSRVARQNRSKLINWLLLDIGEAPKMLDTTSLNLDAENLQNVYFGKGYFHTKVHYEIDTLKRRKAQHVNVRFVIDEGLPYRIRNISLKSPDGPGSRLETHYDLANSLLKPGQNYDHKTFQAERARATEAYRNAGRYTFSPQMIRMVIDSNLQENLAADSLALTEKKLDVEIQILESPPIYSVRSIELEVAPSSGLRESRRIEFKASDLTEAARDSLRLPERRLSADVPHTIVTEKEQIRRINFNFLHRRIHLETGRDYQIQNDRKTQKRLQELGMFRYVVIRKDVVDSLAVIDLKIQTQLANKYQLRIGAEGFTSDLFTTNLPGVGTNIVFRDRNTFKRSEFLELTLAGNLGQYFSATDQDNDPDFFWEIGARARLHVNRLVLPFTSKTYLSNFSPRTSISINYNQENRLDFNRTTTGLNLTYTWQHIPFSDKVVSSITPLAINLIDLTNVDSVFLEKVKLLPIIIQRDYEQRFSSFTAYTFTYQNYGESRLKPTFFSQFNLEVGGYLPYLIDLQKSIGQSDGDSRDNLLFGRIFYGQYLKASVEYKYMIPFDEQSELVLRSLAGYAYAYQNTPVVPYESRFFSGGTNGMRGWISNTLGPGRSSIRDFVPDSISEANSLTLLAPGGEIRFEANVEYRWDIWTYLEMAAFVDVGNVWFQKGGLTGVDSLDAILDPKIVFSWQNLRLGMDAGIGFRFDFSFLILRMDIAQQIFAPDLTKPFVLGNPEVEDRRLQLNIGINYPF